MSSAARKHSSLPVNSSKKSPSRRLPHRRSAARSAPGSSPPPPAAGRLGAAARGLRAPGRGSAGVRPRRRVPHAPAPGSRPRGRPCRSTFGVWNSSVQRSISSVSSGVPSVPPSRRRADTAACRPPAIPRTIGLGSAARLRRIGEALGEHLLACRGSPAQVREPRCADRLRLENHQDAGLAVDRGRPRHRSEGGSQAVFQTAVGGQVSLGYLLDPAARQHIEGRQEALLLVGELLVERAA